jgi:hypothetical protein
MWTGQKHELEQSRKHGSSGMGFRYIQVIACAGSMVCCGGGVESDPDQLLNSEQHTYQVPM